MFSDLEASNSNKSPRYPAMFSYRSPLKAVSQQDPLNKPGGEFKTDVVCNENGKEEIVVLEHKLYEAIIFQLNPDTYEIQIDCRKAAREALTAGNFKFFSALADKQSGDIQKADLPMMTFMPAKL